MTWNPRLVAQLQSLSWFTSITVSGIGCLVILGWLFDIVALKSVLPGFSTMKFNTAVCFVVAGFTLAHNHRNRPGLSLALSISIILVGFLTLVEYLFHWNLGIDQWLVRETAGLQNMYPGRMSPASAFNFCLIGISLLLYNRARYQVMVQLLALVVALISVLSLIGYLYGTQALYQISDFSSVALHTAITFILLSLSILLASPTQGLVAVLVTRHAGGQMTQRLLPAALVTPLLFGWLWLRGQQAGLYGVAFALALFAISNIVVSVILVFWTARSLNHLDAVRAEEEQQRRRADEATRRYAQRLVVLHNIDREIIEAVSIPTVVESAVKHIRQLIPCQMADVVVFDDPPHEGVILAVDLTTASSIAKGMRIPLPSDFLQNIRVNPLIHDTQTVQDPSPLLRQLIKEGIRSSLRTLLVVEGQAIGVLSLNADTPYFFSPEYQQIAAEIANQIAIALYQLRLSEALRQDAAELEQSVAELRQAEAALRQANDQLETRVQERTRELIEINQALEAQITQRKLMEDALRQNEEKLQAIFNVLPVGASLLNSNRQIVQMNRALERILELSMDDLLTGKYVTRKYVHPDGSPVQGYEFPSERALVEQKSVFDVEIGVIKEDGATIWTSVSAAPLPHHQGVVTVTVDITMRKQAEDTLRESEDRFRQLATNIRSMFWLASVQDQKMIYVSPAFETIWGQPRQYLEDHPEVFLNVIQLSDLQRILEDPEFMTSMHNTKEDYPIIRPDGSIRWIQTRVFPIRDQDKTIYRIAGITEDITESKELKKQSFELALEREQIRLLSDFIRDTSHDIRTPLTIISTNLYLLRKTRDPHKQTERIDLLEKQVLLLDTLIGNLHTLSNLDAVTQLNLSPVDINRLLQDLYVHYRQKIREDEHQLIWIPSVLPMVTMVDEEWLKQALINIIDNAILHTDADTTIRLETTQTDNAIIVSVSDDGVGIEPHHLDKIFERFYKVNTARTSGKGGSGIGLSLVKKIIEMHRGHTEVESTPGQGSTFRLFLPSPTLENPSEVVLPPI